MSVDWSIGQPRVDVGQQFQAGLEHGRVVQQQQQRQNALRTLAANPNDPGAQNALLAVDPATSLQLRDQHMQEQQFSHQQALAALQQHRDRINFAGELMDQHPVKDQASYSAVLGAMRQAGYDISDIPQNYDPSYVAGVQQAHSSLQRMEPGYTVVQGATRFRGDGSVEARGNPEPDTVVPITAGGSYMVRHVDPQTGQTHLFGSNGVGGQGGQPPVTATNPQTGARVQLNPVTGQWEPIQGGPTSQASGGFSRQDAGAFDFRANP